MSRLICLVTAVVSGMLLFAEAGALDDAETALARQDWAAAEKAARAQLASAPGHADASALLGFSLFHQEQYKSCAAPLQAAIEGDSVYAARALYYLGLAHSRRNRGEDAADAFATLLTQYPRSAEARRISGNALVVEDTAEDRRGVDVSGTLVSVEGGLDTNPDLTDDGDTDLLLSLYASTDIAFEDWPFLLGTSMFLEKYADQSDNDYLSLSLDANRLFELSDRSVIDAAVELSQSWVDFDAYERELRLSGDWDKRWNDQWRTRMRLGLGLVSAEDDSTSDGTRTRLRVRAYRYLERDSALRRVRFQAQLRGNDRDVKPDGYDSVLLGVEGRWPVADDATLDVGLDYETREYDGTFSDTRPVRDDDTLDLSGYFQKRLDDRRYLTCQAVITSRDSNINFYSADEFLLTVGLLWIP